MKTIDPVQTITPVEVIARTTADNAEAKASVVQFSVAVACYGSIRNYVDLIEMQLTSSAFCIEYSNEGYAIVKRSTRVEVKFSK